MKIITSLIFCILLSSPAYADLDYFLPYKWGTSESEIIAIEGQYLKRRANTSAEVMVWLNYNANIMGIDVKVMDLLKINYSS